MFDMQYPWGISLVKKIKNKINSVFLAVAF